jgi:pimeloyl-ACP methyl ester carboxylesterase
MTDLAANTYREYPVVFPAGGEDLYGIFVEPARPRADVGVVLATGGGFIAMTHRNRMWVHLARMLAAKGFPVFRFDYHGVGESTGDAGELSLDIPFTEDLRAAVDWVRRLGIKRLVLVGSCFGARTILASASRLPGAEAAVFLSVPVGGHKLGEGAATRFARELTIMGYVRKTLRARVFARLFDPEWRRIYARVASAKVRTLVSRNGRAPVGAEDVGLRWVSRKYLDPLRQLARERFPILMVYGEDEEHYQDFRRAHESGLGRIIEEARGAFEIRMVDGVLHGFTTPAAQAAAITTTYEWICARYGAGVATPAAIE